MTWRSSIWYQRGLLYNPREPNSWRSVLEAINRLATLREPTYVWRGHESIDWLLVPSIYRKLGLTPPFATQQEAAEADTAVNREVEAILRRSEGHGYDFLQGRPIGELTHLALLQHSGAATPLLDVTADPLVALYFACRPGQHDNRDAVLLAIDARSQRMAHFDVSWGESWTESLAHLQGQAQATGIYTPTPLVTPRLLAQRGRFIFGATPVGVPYSAVCVAERDQWDIKALWQLFGHRGPGRPAIPPVVAIRVAAAHKQPLREVLDTAFGLNQESLFPDLAGFASAHGVDAAPLSGSVRSTV
jgi:hypothetical protein